MFSVSQTFKGFENAGSGVTFLGQKIVFVLGNLANVALAMYKCHSMGLLPTHVSGDCKTSLYDFSSFNMTLLDWLAFADPLERAEISLSGNPFN